LHDCAPEFVEVFRQLDTEGLVSSPELWGRLLATARSDRGR
jgi:hypothetical protein